MKNENSVCFIATIGELKPIEGADKIELAIIKGWQSIVQKGIHKIEDYVICMTTDAVIPESLAEKAQITTYLRKGNRVRTIKLKGVYSECILLPVSTQHIYMNGRYEGDDVMKEMGVFKYEEPVKQIQLASGRKIKYKDNPNFHVYYKFPNHKNVPNIFNEKDTVTITRKIHGTNARYGIVKKNKLSFIDRIRKFAAKYIVGAYNEWYEYDFVMGSHNVEKGSDSQGFYDIDVWKKIEEEYFIKERLWRFVKEQLTPEQIGSGYIVYGEIYGPGIQKNYDYGLKGIQFIAFDIEVNGEFLNHSDSRIEIQYKLNLPHVEILYIGPWSKEIQEQYMFNQFIEGTKIPHEGVVVKCVTGDKRKRAKCINPDYLIFAEKNNVSDGH